MVIDIIEELLDLDLGVQAGIAVVDEHLQRGRCGNTEGVKLRENMGLPFMDVFDVLGYGFSRDGKGVQGTEKTLWKGLGGWWCDGHIHRARSVPQRTECYKVVSHVFSTALNGSIKWLWSVARTTQICQ